MMRRRRWFTRVMRMAAIGTGCSLLAVVLVAVSSDVASAIAAPCLGSPQVLPLAAAGDGTTYSLDRNGSLWGWGHNYFGQIGNGARADATIPLNASGFNSLQAVSAGDDHVVVLRQDGAVWAWGDGQYGQLGDGQSGFNVMSVVPKRVQGLPTNVVAIAAGGGSSFAVTSTGTVWAWGRNDYGQLGDGTTTNRSVPTQITALSGVVAIAPGTHTLALKSDGTVKSFGENVYGDLGQGFSGGLGYNPIGTVSFPAGVTIKSVSASGFHSMALDQNGNVWDWGQGFDGELGNGAYSNSSTPVQVLNPAGSAPLSGISAVADGGNYGLALSSGGTVWSWGSNAVGQLGNTAGATYQPVPVQVSTISGVMALAPDTALTADGSVWDWGYNGYGEIGDSTTNTRWTPYQTSVTQAAPAAPTNLSAAAGNGLAYLAWSAPTSAMTQYQVTPYLNGAEQTPVAAPVGASSFTVPGLTQGGNYTFTVAGQNCLGTGTPSAASNHVIPTGVQLDQASASVESSRLTDRMGLHVNTFNGNLAVSEHDVGIKGTGLDLVLDRTYNNLSLASSIFGRGWTMSGGTNVSLTVLGDGSVFFNGPTGSQVGFAKNPDGSFTAPSGVDATLVHNTDGTYTLTSNAAADVWRFTSAGVATSHADRNAKTISYAYGGPGGAISSVTDTQGRVTSFAYNAANLVATITDPAGRVYRYGYDGANNLTTYTDPTNAVTRFAYASNNLTQITTPAGAVVTIGYDASHRVSSIAHPGVTGTPTTSFSYSGSTTVVTDADGHATTYTYDPVGRATNVTDALGNAVSASYTSDSNVATYSSGNGSAGGSFAYDNLNNLNQAAVVPGAHSTLAYGDPSHPYLPTAVTDPQNNTTALTYDAKGNVIGETDALPASNHLSVNRNADGTVANIVNPDGQPTASYGYDSHGNLTSVTPAAPLGPTAIVVDAISRPTRVTDGKGQATTYTYDALDRVTAIGYADGTSVARTYNADGDVLTMTDASGVTTMTYDAMNRLLSRSTPDGITVSYTYDGVGNMLTLTDPGGTTTYGYNAVNLCTRVTDPDGRPYAFGYDANNNRTTTAYPNGVVTTATYDAANRLLNTTTLDPAGHPVVSSGYGYTPSGPTHGSARAVAMEGAPSTFATDGTIASAVTLATPTGLTVGAVEVAQISTAGIATVTSVPAGWSLVREDLTGASANDLRQGIYTHVAQASEPAVNTWGLSQATSANGGLSAWTGVDTASPVQDSSGQVSSSGSTFTAPSVNHVNGEVDLAFFGGRLYGGATALSVPAGYAAAYDTQTNWVTVGMDSRTLGATAGPTGDQSVTGPYSWWVGQQVLLRPVYDTSLAQTTTAEGAVTYDALNRVTATASGYTYAYDGTGNRTSATHGSQVTSTYYNSPGQPVATRKSISLVGTTFSLGAQGPLGFTPPVPAGVVGGDQILLSITAPDVTVPSVPGYALVATTNTAAVATHTSVFRRTATATAADAPTVSLVAGVDPTAVVAVYRGVDPANPVDDVSAASPLVPGLTTTVLPGSTITVPAVAASVPGEQVVLFQGAVAPVLYAPWTPPSGFGVWQWKSSGDQTAMAGVADKPLGTTTGSTGPLTSTVAALTPQALAGVALTLRPANPSFSFDANGNATSSSDGFAASYDAADRTTSLTTPGGSPVSFSYRGPGQTERVSMSPATRIAAPCAVLSGCPPSTTSLGTTARFEHSALGITAETDDGIITHYTRDPYGQLINERSPSGIYDYLFDGHGSVIALVADCCGYWLEGTYGYDPYGQLTSMTSSHAAVVHNPWRYAGAYQDGTGLYKMGARYYDPSTGRFTQQDPIVNPLDPKQWNRYVYSGDDPVNFSDPSGLNVVTGNCGTSWIYAERLNRGRIAIHAGFTVNSAAIGYLAEITSSVFSPDRAFDQGGLPLPYFSFGGGLLFRRHWSVVTQTLVSGSVLLAFHATVLLANGLQCESLMPTDIVSA